MLLVVLLTETNESELAAHGLICFGRTTSHYDQRLAEAQQIILRETHSNLFDAPTPAGVAKIPDKDALIAKADHRIRQDYQNRIAAIRKDEIRQYQDLRQSIVNRDQQAGQAQATFEQVQKMSPQRARSGPGR